MTAEQKEKYRALRNGLGVLLAVAWVAYWALKPSEAGIVGSFSHGAGVFFAVITAPFAFLVSHYLARFQVSRTAAEEQRRTDEEIKLAETKRAQTLREREAASVASAHSARQLLDRQEFIHKLGTADDALDLQIEAADPDRASLARQAVNRALRDLVAKHSLPELVGLIAGDEGARLRLRALLSRFRELGPLPPDAEILQHALDRS